MYLLYKLEFWVRIKMIFYSKNISKSGAIFLHGKVCLGYKNIHDLSQIFLSKKNWGCFGAQVSEVSSENEYFSFMKNIHLIILRIDQRNKADRPLGWKLRIWPSDKSIWNDSNSNSNQGKNHNENQVRKEREGKSEKERRQNLGCHR